MNLFDRVRGSFRGLAADDSKRPARRPGTDTEIGVSGDFNALYDREEARTDEITIDDYRKMLDNDGTVEALYNLLTLPIKAAKGTFVIPEGEQGGKAELELVTDNFERPPHKGGMSTPFDLVLADMLRGLFEGFRLYEKVWTLRDGKFVYRKLAPRDSSTLSLLRDEHGGFAGARQKTWDGLRYIDVTIPVQSCFLFTYAKERSYLYGRSILKSAHYHYDRKHKLYYLQQLIAQGAAVPPKKLTVPEAVANNDAKLAAAKSAADELGGTAQTIALPPGFELDEYKTQPYKLTEDINHHDTLIARSVLAQWLVLAGSSTGSYSLGESDKENFLQALQGVMKQIEDHINFFLIPDLINYNFGSGVYPEFHFENLDPKTRDLMGKAFEKLLARPDLPGYIIEGITKEVADELGIEVPETAKPAAGADLSDSTGTDLADAYDRQLTAAEKRVNLSDVAKRFETAEERLTAEAEAFYASLKDDTTKRLRSLLDKGDLASLKGYQLGSFAPYRKILETGMMEQYLYGKRSAADEVGGKIPQTPSKSRQYVTSQARMVADKQQADLTFAVTNEVTTELRRQNLSDDVTNLSIADVIARVVGAFAAFQTNVSTGIAVSLAGSLNLGRGDSFGASSDVDRMQYSAILDNRTTRMCRSLDNSVVTYEEYLATKWVPPVHFGCRSIWVAILKDDSFKPDFRPIPAAPGGHTEPQL